MKISFLAIPIIFCFMLLTVLAWADSSVDTLKEKLVLSEGKERLNTLEKIVDYYMDNNLDSSYYYVKMLEVESVFAKNEGFESTAYTSLGLYYFFKGKYFEAENYLEKAIEIQERLKDTVRLAHSYNVLAGIYGESGNYKKSIKTLYKALDIYEKTNNVARLETIYNNWGYLYMKLEDYQNAAKYFNQALDIIHHHQLKNNQGFLYLNLGICEKAFKKYDTAFIYFRKALAEFEKNKTFNAIPMVYQSMGNIYAFNIFQPDSAQFYFSKGITLAKKYDPNSLIELYYSLGSFYEQEGKLSASEDAFGKSLEVSLKSNDLNGQKLAYHALFQVNKKLKRLPEAIEFYQQYVTVKDSIDKKETLISISRLEEKYNNEKNLIYIQQLKAKQEADQELKLILLAGIVLLVILLFFVSYGIRQRKKRNLLEKELLKSEKEKVENKLQYQNRQLASQALIMLQKNKILQHLYNSLNKAPNDPENFSQFIQNLKNQIRRNIHSEKEWELFKLYFEQVNVTFFRKIKEINPSLTQNDIRLAALIKLGFNIKETASILSLSPNSIKGARHRLRKKLKLTNDEDLAQFIESIA